jgi:hypothetical protein
VTEEATRFIDEVTDGSAPNNLGCIATALNISSEVAVRQ